MRLHELVTRTSKKKSLYGISGIFRAWGWAWKVQGGTRHSLFPKGTDNMAGDVRRGSKNWKLQLPYRTSKIQNEWFSVFKLQDFKETDLKYRRNDCPQMNKVTHETMHSHLEKGLVSLQLWK